MNYVYVVATVAGERHISPCKVGITGNLQSRIRTLRTASPVDLRFAFTFPVDRLGHARVVEKLTHACLKQYRLRGEWFKIHPAYAVNVVTSAIELVCSGEIPLYSEKFEMFRQRSGIRAAIDYCESQFPGQFIERAA